MPYKKALDDISKALSGYDFSKTIGLSDFSKLNDLNSLYEKPYESNIDLSDYLGPSPKELTNLQIEKQNEILDFLKLVTLKQSETSERQYKSADKQFKTTTKLTRFIIFLTLISICFMGYDYFKKDNQQVLIEKISVLIDKESQNTEVISDMSIRLLSLQNQVQTLEKENKLLLKKNE
jgi:hypothetical protein|tara:strand:+ start:496 stop:1029 length:534 start_codon:yes stop_codon:yes gene_type:complete